MRYTLDKNLAIDLVRVTEAASLAASNWIGRGDEKSADAAAVEAMRGILNNLDINGEVVIGEGERDKAPMLFIGEKVGTNKGPSLDIALDPLEGTTVTAQGRRNAIAVIAAAKKGNFLNAPDVYMKKIGVGIPIRNNEISLKKSPTENIKAYSEITGKRINDILVCILDRERHNELIAEVRSLGCRINLIGDGDVAAVIATADSSSDLDIYMGVGGAPEGVLAAAALQCIGGYFEGQLIFRNDDEISRAHKVGVKDLDKIYNINELAHGEIYFAATGVTSGTLLEGVRIFGSKGKTSSLVMRASTGTVRYINAYHDFKKKDWMLS